MPMRATLSVKHGPTPRPVVPMAAAPRSFSSAMSISGCQGMITWQRSLTKRFATLTPRDASWSISLSTIAGSRATPLPMMHVLSG